MVVTDIDGTIAREDGSLTPAALQASRELAARGVPLIAATARVPSGLTFLEPEMPAFTVAVCCNGSLGVDLRHGRPPWPPPWDELWRHQLSTATVGKIVSALTARLPDAGIAAFDGSGWVMTASYLTARGRKPRAPSRLTDAAALAAADAFALSVCHPGIGADQVAGELARAGITPADATLSNADPRLLDVSPAGVDKASGVARALDILGIAPEDAVAFGDAPNDIPLFKLAGRAVAVANAHPDLLAVADAVTESVTDDGFSRELRRLGLIGPYQSS
ncbi:MAG: HAD family hydrolase [Trebonia sp.]